PCATARRSRGRSCGVELKSAVRDERNQKKDNNEMVINLPAAISWRRTDRALELLRSSVECRTLYEFLPGFVGVLEKINVEHEVRVAGGAAGDGFHQAFDSIGG